MAGAFLLQQQGGGLTQRLIHQFFTKDITPDTGPCPIWAVPVDCSASPLRARGLW